jgi:hypothetical protein
MRNHDMMKKRNDSLLIQQKNKQRKSKINGDDSLIRGEVISYLDHFQLLLNPKRIFSPHSFFIIK